MSHGVGMHELCMTLNLHLVHMQICFVNDFSSILDYALTVDVLFLASISWLLKRSKKMLEYSDCN